MPFPVVRAAERFEVLGVVLAARVVADARVDRDPVVDVELVSGPADGAAAGGAAARGRSGERPDVGLVERGLAAGRTPAGPMRGDGLPVPPAAAGVVRSKRERTGRRVDGRYCSGTGNDRARSHIHKPMRGGDPEKPFPTGDGG